MNKNNVAVDVGDKGPSFSAGWNIYWSKFLQNNMDISTKTGN